MPYRVALAKHQRGGTLVLGAFLRLPPCEVDRVAEAILHLEAAGHVERGRQHCPLQWQGREASEARPGKAGHHGRCSGLGVPVVRACSAQPRATASEAFMVRESCLPKNPSSALHMAGARLQPPTTSTNEMSSTDSPAEAWRRSAQARRTPQAGCGVQALVKRQGDAPDSASADLAGSSARARIDCASSSNFSRVSCAFTSTSFIRHSIANGDSGLDESTFFACHATTILSKTKGGARAEEPGAS